MSKEVINHRFKTIKLHFKIGIRLDFVSKARWKSKRHSYSINIQTAIDCDVSHLKYAY
jgi:hypothetical protein